MVCSWKLGISPPLIQDVISLGFTEWFIVTMFFFLVVPLHVRQRYIVVGRLCVILMFLSFEMTWSWCSLKLQIPRSKWVWSTVESGPTCVRLSQTAPSPSHSSQSRPSPASCCSAPRSRPSFTKACWTLRRCIASSCCERFSKNTQIWTSYDQSCIHCNGLLLLYSYQRPGIQKYLSVFPEQNETNHIKML